MDLKPYQLIWQQQLIASTQRLRKRWQLLSQREQYLLSGLGVFLVILVFYQFFYLPLQNGIERYRAELISDQELLVFMQTAEPRIQQATEGFTPLEALTVDLLLTTVENSLEKDNLSRLVTEFGLTNNHVVSIQFKEVNFDELLAWLVEIHVQYGIQVAQLTAVPTSLPGISDVAIQLTLAQK